MGKNILIVDDDHSNRLLLLFALKAGNFEIYQAGTGFLAQQLIQTTQFDFALIDIELPDMNGLNLVKLLRQTSSEIILIMSTATDHPTMLAQACANGADGYLVKPYGGQQILFLINELELHPVQHGQEMLILGNNTELHRYAASG